MPTKAEHIHQAQHNEAFYQTIDRAAYSDWAVTVTFSAALHSVDAFLAAQAGGIHPGDHRLRERHVQRVAQLRPLWNHDHRLKTRSRNARYNATRFTNEEVRRVFDDDLGAIKRHFLPLI